jgi:hypothetical protein
MTASITYIDFASAKKKRTMDSEMNNVLLLDTAGMSGMYVITDGINSQEVVASGANPVDAYSEAVKLGVSDPVLVYIPTESEGTSVLWQN